MSTTQIFPTESDPDWGIILAEAFDSNGGSAGDHLTVNITSKTPANQHIYLFSDDLKIKKMTKDKITRFIGGDGLKNRLNQSWKKVSIRNSSIPFGTMAEFNKLRAILDEWEDEGSSQDKGPIYAAFYIKNSSDTKEYATFEIDRVTQNWMRCELVMPDYSLSHAEIIANITLEQV